MLSINPYKAVDDLYSNDVIDAYMSESMHDQLPHLFAFGLFIFVDVALIHNILLCDAEHSIFPFFYFYCSANEAYQSLVNTKVTQKILLTGDSGAGKTESAKYILKFLCHTKSSSKIRDKIVAADTLLEAFGNARTSNNDNSSRFCKLTQVKDFRSYCIVLIWCFYDMTILCYLMCISTAISSSFQHGFLVIYLKAAAFV